MTEYSDYGGVNYPEKREWINIAIEYPPYDIPVLVTDGIRFQIRTLKLDNDIKYWSTDHQNDMAYSTQYWMFLPELPKDN